nr:MAG TPA: hypothetical protein [Caudoviricetes sp.]
MKYTINPTITHTKKIIHEVNVTLYSKAANNTIEIIGDYVQELVRLTNRLD